MGIFMNHDTVRGLIQMTINNTSIAASSYQLTADNFDNDDQFRDHIYGEHGCPRIFKEWKDLSPDERFRLVEGYIWPFAHTDDSETKYTAALLMKGVKVPRSEWLCDPTEINTVDVPNAFMSRFYGSHSLYLHEQTVESHSADENGWSKVMDATVRNDKKTLDWYFEYAGDPKGQTTAPFTYSKEKGFERNDNGTTITPIMIAGVYGNKDAAESMLARDSTIMTHTNKDGYNMMHAAALWGNPGNPGTPERAAFDQTVDLFIKNGGDINAPLTGKNPKNGCKKGDTPIMVAVRTGNAPMAQLLFDRGAQVQIEGQEESLLVIATKSGNQEMMQTVLGFKDKDGNPAVNINA